MGISDEILEDGGVLVGELDEIEHEAQSLRERVARVCEQVAADRQALLDQIQSMRDELTEFVGDLRTASERMIEAGTQMQGQIQGVAESFAAQLERVSSDANEVESVASGVCDALKAGCLEVQEMSSAFDDESGQRIEFLGTLQAETQSRGESARQAIDELRERDDALHEEVDRELQDFTARTSQAADSFSTATHEEVFAPAKSALEELQRQLRDVGESRVKLPIEAAGGELSRHIESELADALTELFNYIEDAIDKVVDKIKNGTDGANGSRRGLEGPRQQLEALVEPIKEALQNVLHIASIVDFRA